MKELVLGSLLLGCISSFASVVCYGTLDLIGGQPRDYKYEIFEKNTFTNFNGVKIQNVKIESYSKPFTDFVAESSYNGFKNIKHDGSVEYIALLQDSNSIKGNFLLTIVDINSEDGKVKGRLTLFDRESYELTCEL